MLTSADYSRVAAIAAPHASCLALNYELHHMLAGKPDLVSELLKSIHLHKAASASPANAASSPRRPAAFSSRQVLCSNDKERR
ncbi:hypothetical protein BHE74_00031182 [Ensete ventricosum]|uniref:Uncharacterized protein n=1 Tax=Ensete ventricosum TaxID=4639 RepID=A0A444DCI8_ENSVE|nr:hypothetical protein B296_00041310 [Ensete ventricosum]RWV95834.1 hypothetical protein GW17_00041501 [Ensete ventricosum]RWW61734.1 hypothetical protein BHE74_00031182 [Ensete ventricosum]RZS11914.1 hypothetical protein BHM03_00043310 [Ensete ventricosum]